MRAGLGSARPFDAVAKATGEEKAWTGMSDDYFDDAPDTDFLELAHQLDARGNTDRGTRRGNIVPGNAGARSNAKGSSSAKSASATRVDAARSESTKTNQSTSHALRPGFNAIIVNTRQVEDA
jgi:hypothetical protein